MKRNKFSLSHYKLLTGDLGVLYPITWYEVLPGDTIQHRTNMLIRFSPMLAPVMHPVRVRIHHWFVPYRLIWDDFESFITGGEDQTDTTVPPKFSVAAITEGSLHDYLGVPTDAAYSPNLEFSALPARAYSTIFNEHYRDQQLVTALTVSKGNSTDSTTNTSLQKVSWEKDYFTTSRPDEQLGTEVTIPIGTSAPLAVDADRVTNQGEHLKILDADDEYFTMQAQSGDNYRTGISSFQSGHAVFADLSAATGISISDLRLYSALQRYKEARNEFGSRYVEYLAYLGIRSSDARLQNPEYLGGGRQVVNFSEIVSTADSGTDVVGTLRGHGISALRTNRYRRFFEEHGLVMSLMSIVPKAIYANGLHRSFSKTSKEDYFQRELAHVGDMAVKDSEVYAAATDPTATFSYQNRYDEYRYHPSMIHGEFRSTLNHWHYARLLGSEPNINSSFIECAPTKRQYADNVSDSVYIMANHAIQARRMMPKFAGRRLL